MLPGGPQNLAQAAEFLQRAQATAFVGIASHLRLLVDALSERRSDRGEIRADMESIHAMFPRLALLRLRTAGYLSGGEMQMLLLGRALMARPKLLPLDEPSMGLAPMLVREIFDRVLQVRDTQGLAVLLVEQNVRAALRIADYGYVIENGRIVLHGPREELAQNEDIREFYLGLTASAERRRFSDVKHYKRRKRWLG